MKYEIITYDLWGNEDGCWVVNAAYTTGVEVEIQDVDNDEEIFNVVRSTGYLHYGVEGTAIELKDIHIDGDPDYSL
jgi:hypothetical protein